MVRSGVGIDPPQPSSVLGVSVQAWFSNDDVLLAPGNTITLPLTVHNLGDNTESYTIVPAGLSASWASVARGNLTLFGGAREVIEVTVTPPPLPSTTAGPTAISIRVIPLGDSDDAIVAEATVTIEPFDDLRIVPLQPVQRARHRATYEFMVENHGNTVSSCRLHLIDPTDRVDGDFDPPAVGVAPGAASLIRLKVRAQRGTFRRATRTLDFEVEAARQGHDPVSCAAALVQSPTIPAETAGRAGVVLALLAGLVVGWFAVVRPAIDDAVSDEVDSRLAELGLSTGEASSPDSTAAGQSSGDDGPSTSSHFRLQVAAPPEQTLDETYTMPDGEIFDLTDIRIENANNDAGTATLLVNGDTEFVWGLDNVRGFYWEPRITPIRLLPGDNITFSVRCDEVGDPTQSTCVNAINITGETIAEPSG